MRKDAEGFTVQSAPAISIAVSELKKSAGTNHRMQSVVIHPNESVEIFPKSKSLNERDRYFTPSLHHPREEIRLLNPCSWIEPRWKTHPTFLVINLGRNEMSFGQLNRQPSCGDLIQIDSKEKEEVHEIDSVECTQCE